MSKKHYTIQDYWKYAGETPNLGMLLDIEKSIKNLPSGHEHCFDLYAVDDDGCSALHKAAMHGNYEIVVHLIEKSFKIDQRNSHGYNVYHLAIINNKCNLINYFFSTKLSVTETKSSKDENDVIIAAKRSEVSTLDFLIRKKMAISPNTKLSKMLGVLDKHGRNVYLIAILNNTLEMIKHIETEYKNDVSFSLTDNFAGNAIVNAALRGDVEIFKHLQDKKYSLKATNMYGTDCYSLAASENKVELMRHIDSIPGFNNKRFNNYGLNALMVAAYYNKEKAVEYLIEEKNWDVSIKSTGHNQNIMEIAVEQKAHKVVDYLKKYLTFEEVDEETNLKEQFSSKCECIICTCDVEEEEKWCKCKNNHILHYECYQELSDGQHKNIFTCSYCTEIMVKKIFTNLTKSQTTQIEKKEPFLNINPEIVDTK